MMKTPDEIKKGLKCCHSVGRVLQKELWCEKVCPYMDEKYGCGQDYLHDDALAYIQQMEAQNAELLEKVEQLETKCHQLEHERDAAVADIPRACGYCKWFEINRGGNMTECHNPNGCRNISGINTGWKWRGVKED